MIMIFCSMMLSQTYVVLQIPQAIVESVFSITDNSFLILLLINLILLFVGMIVNDTTGIILVLRCCCRSPRPSASTPSSMRPSSA